MSTRVRGITFCVSLFVAVFGINLFVSWMTHAGNPYLTVPVYGAGAAPGADPAPNDTNKRLDNIEAKVDDVNRKLDKLLAMVEEEAGDRKDKDKANGTVPAALESGLTKCFGCHAQSIAPKKAKGFVIFTDDGILRPFTGRDVNKLVKEVSDGTMPPKEANSPLTPEESAELVKVFKASPAASRP